MLGGITINFLIRNTFDVLFIYNDFRQQFPLKYKYFFEPAFAIKVGQSAKCYVLFLENWYFMLHKNSYIIYI